MKNEISVTKIWKKAQTQIKNNDLEKLEDTLDLGIMCLAQYTLDGKGDKELVENVKMETWKERFWIAIEKHIWPTRSDYETYWKC